MDRMFLRKAFWGEVMKAEVQAKCWYCVIALLLVVVQLLLQVHEKILFAGGVPLESDSGRTCASDARKTVSIVEGVSAMLRKISMEEK